MSNMEEEPILDTPDTEDEVLASLEHEPPKPLLLLIAIILGSLSMILSLVAIVQTKQEPGPGTSPGIGSIPVDGGAGLDNLLERIDAIEQKVAQLSAVPSEFNAGGGSSTNPAIEHEVGALRTELDSLRAKVDNLRLGAATSSSRPPRTGNPASATTSTTPPPVPSPTTPPAATLTVPPGGKVHELQSGETLSALSKKYGIPLSRIESANQGLDFRKLQIGQKIIIPPAN